jgi:hypothetical protein
MKAANRQHASVRRLFTPGDENFCDENEDFCAGNGDCAAPDVVFEDEKAMPRKVDSNWMGRMK